MPAEGPRHSSELAIQGAAGEAIARTRCSPQAQASGVPSSPPSSNMMSAVGSQQASESAGQDAITGDEDLVRAPCTPHTQGNRVYGIWNMVIMNLVTNWVALRAIGGHPATILHRLSIHIFLDGTRGSLKQRLNKESRTSGNVDSGSR
jgi:hypothetical protein